MCDLLAGMNVEMGLNHVPQGGEGRSLFTSARSLSQHIAAYRNVFFSTRTHSTCFHLIPSVSSRKVESGANRSTCFHLIPRVSTFLHLFPDLIFLKGPPQYATSSLFQRIPTYSNVFFLPMAHRAQSHRRNPFTVANGANRNSLRGFCCLLLNGSLTPFNIF